MFAALGRDMRRVVRSLARGGLSTSAIAEELDLPAAEVRAVMEDTRWGYLDSNLMHLPRNSFWV